MDNSQFGWFLGMTVVVLLGFVAVVATRYSRQQRDKSRQVLLAWQTRHDWKPVTSDNESLVPFTRQGPYAIGNLSGTWQGHRAEFVVFYVYKWKTASSVAVACIRMPAGFKGVAAIDASFEYATGNDVGPVELSKRFRLTGKSQDLMTIFAPEVEKDILEFPQQIRSVTMDETAASVTWLGWEADAAIVERALEIARSLTAAVAAMAAASSRAGS